MSPPASALCGTGTTFPVASRPGPTNEPPEGDCTKAPMGLGEAGVPGANGVVGESDEWEKVADIGVKGKGAGWWLGIPRSFSAMFGKSFMNGPQYCRMCTRLAPIQVIGNQRENSILPSMESAMYRKRHKLTQHWRRSLSSNGSSAQ